MLIAENDYLGEVFRPILFYVFSIPKSIFLPMFILIFGIGFGQKVAYAAFSTTFVVIMSAAAAVESVKADHILVARSCGATRGQILTRVYVPSMLPVLLEMYASRTGIGHLIANWGENFQMRQLFAGVITHSLTEAVYLADEVLVMSARPGRIIDRLPVTLSRPRTYEMMATDTFGRLRDRIWQQIRKTAQPGLA